jgi:NAD(P)-dependent dehydrogenase (short-subunit alcohol dehydrogenase family)
MFTENKEDGYNGWVAYGQAKTANILFSCGLNEKLKEKGVASYAVHPGCKWRAALCGSLMDADVAKRYGLG